MPEISAPKPTIDYASVVVLSGSIHNKIVAEFRVCPGTTVSEWLEESGYDIEIRKAPYLIVHNAVPLLERDFTTKLSVGDVLTVIPQPGIAWLPFIGWTIVAASTAYSLYLAFTQAPTDIDTQGDRSSTYNISYRGNRAKPGAPIPVVYGTIRTHPDLSSNSYTQYNANGEQILYQLFEFTQGEADITDMRYGDTLLSSFDDIDIEKMVRVKDHMGFLWGPSHHGRWADELRAIREYLSVDRSGLSTRE